MFLLDIDFIFIFLFIINEACWLVIAIENGLWIIELYQSHLDVSAVLVVKNDVVRELFHKIL